MLQHGKTNKRIIQELFLLLPAWNSRLFLQVGKKGLQLLHDMFRDIGLIITQ